MYVYYVNVSLFDGQDDRMARFNCVELGKEWESVVPAIGPGGVVSKCRHLTSLK